MKILVLYYSEFVSRTENRRIYWINVRAFAFLIKILKCLNSTYFDPMEQLITIFSFYYTTLKKSKIDNKTAMDCDFKWHSDVFPNSYCIFSYCFSPNLFCCCCFIVFFLPFLFATCSGTVNSMIHMVFVFHFILFHFKCK